MGLKQAEFFGGKTKEEVTLDRIRQFEPPAGYYVAFSGGKDSIVIRDLVLRAVVRHDIHYSLTTMDPPEVVQFIKTFDDVIIEHPPETMWKLILKKGMPRRQARWCCEELKERGGSGRLVLTGVRAAESVKRRHRKMVETCYTDTTKTFFHPIIDWTEAEVWEYIKERGLEYCSLYDEGFKRIGCVLCPMTRDIKRQMERWPKIAAAWQRACYRLWDRHTKGTDRFPTPEAFWYWWLDRDAKAPDNARPRMFD